MSLPTLRPGRFHRRLIGWTVAVGTVVACGGASTGPSASAPAASPSAAGIAIVTGNPSHPVTLSESGASLLLPYLQKLADPLHQAYPNITLSPSAGGSGKGVSDAISGAVVMGGSDAFLTDAQVSQNPGLLNIPIAVSSQDINYNLTGISDLKLNGEVAAKIYSGKIVKWNDPAIATLNGGVTLPDQTIVPVRQQNASGDTANFTSYLSQTSSDWKGGPGSGTTVTWPDVAGELTTTGGNSGMVQTCQQAVGCIAYVGSSFAAAARQAGLGTAQLQNKVGTFVKPTPDTVLAAVNAHASLFPDNLSVSAVYQDGPQAYPIVNFEYLMVKQKQPDAETALAVRTFLAWAIDPTKGESDSTLSTVNFIPLPVLATPKIRAVIARIGA